MKPKDDPELIVCFPWLRGLGERERSRVQHELQPRVYEPGEPVCRRGEPAPHWIGVRSGLLMLTPGSEKYLGVPAVAPGGWFGEDVLGRSGAWVDELVALRRSRVYTLPVETFLTLREQSLGFNQVLLGLLDERMRNCLEQGRMPRAQGADERIVHSLLWLFNPVLHPAVGHLLRVTQEELGVLCRLSRQRVNQAMQTLAARDLLRLRYGGVEVPDLGRLQAYAAELGVPREGHAAQAEVPSSV